MTGRCPFTGSSRDIGETGSIDKTSTLYFILPFYLFFSIRASDFSVDETHLVYPSFKQDIYDNFIENEGYSYVITYSFVDDHNL